MKVFAKALVVCLPFCTNVAAAESVYQLFPYSSDTPYSIVSGSLTISDSIDQDMYLSSGLLDWQINFATPDGPRTFSPDNSIAAGGFVELGEELTLSPRLETNFLSFRSKQLPVVGFGYHATAVEFGPPTSPTIVFHNGGEVAPVEIGAPGDAARIGIVVPEPSTRYGALQIVWGLVLTHPSIRRVWR